MSFATDHDLVEAAPIRSKPFYIWMDFETTGLDYDTDVPLEFGCVLTNKWGEVIPETDWESLIWESVGPQANHYRSMLANMAPFVRNMHTNSGLVDEITALRLKVSDEPEQGKLYTGNIIAHEVVEFLKESNVEPQQLRIAGSSIHFDKTFLHNFLPNIEAFLHYRALDVSSYIETCQNTNPILAAKMPAKNEVHRPLADIADSIRAYNWMLQEFVMPDWRVYENGE